MNRADAAKELAAALGELKQRSGLSYQELSQRVFMSSSTLHRYCNGKGVPGDYDAVVRMAKECGAAPGELNDLLRYWKAATGEEPDPGSTSAAEVPGARPVFLAASDRAPVDPATSHSQAGRRSPGTRLALAVALAVIVLVSAVASNPRKAGTAPGPTPVGATSWTQAPTPVSPELFGVTMNSSSGAMPSFRAGALRLWDSETRWAQLDPDRGEFDWSTLDRLLDGAEQAGLPTLFVFGGTPAWAAPNRRKAAYPDGSRAAPPDDLNDWDTFVRALVRHAGDRIDAYELWVMANHPHHYNGSVETLVEMTRRASRIIRAVDAHAVVVCPSITELWKEQAHEYLLRFAELGGYQHCDAAGIKLYQHRVTDPPETMLEAVRKVDRTFQRAGYHLPLWNTGTTQTLPLNDPLEENQAANYAVRFYLTGLYARKRGLARMYFYAWGNGSIPLVLQAEGQPPTKAALFVERLQQWLAHAEVRGCGHGLQIALPENVWQCEFLIPDENDTLHAARIRWTHTGTADVPVGAGAQRVEYLDGRARTVDSQDTERITERPVLITYRESGTNQLTSSL
ncbi:helix-turn-helix domain-containing protein [Streptomyces viridochromogenes]|uniref:helix-turn-helix domain-containing protein n=1 Tax=Streptomyces viridochromogenes TaxID=1938 RepID=UPI0007C6E513|nr:helix-turn-helix domain-containing protein [Streptomyces viridochromogenes]